MLLGHAARSSMWSCQMEHGGTWQTSGLRCLGPVAASLVTAHQAPKSEPDSVAREGERVPEPGALAT